MINEAQVYERKALEAKKKKKSVLENRKCSFTGVSYHELSTLATFKKDLDKNS